MSDSPFSYRRADFERIAELCLAHARAQGASAAELDVSEGIGQAVTVRKNEIETIEYNRDRGLNVTVYAGQRRGNASTADLSEAAIRATVDKALTIARYTAEDPHAGLADVAWLATAQPDLDLYHPWTLSVESAAEMARDCEAAAFAVDRRIDNSEGATVQTQAGHFLYANSLGFVGGYASSRHGMSCAVIGVMADSMQRDYWYASARNAGDLPNARTVGRIAGERTVRRLGGRQLSTRQCPVIFEAPIASSLVSSFVGAVSGGPLYRKSSFLLDSLGKPVFAPWVQLDEKPFLPRASGSTPFDDEGVAAQERSIVRNGEVQGYFLGSYSARKLGMRSTGNAGGSHNLVLQPGEHDLAGLLREMGSGLLVTEMLGQGVNMVTGDYSRGAAGFWVENGEVQYPVEEITIAANLKDVFRNLVAAGRDVDSRGAKHVGSLLAETMTIAGN
jgi:PmbA protein